MEKISKDKFIDLLEKDNLTLVVIDKNNQKVEVMQNIEYIFDTNFSENKFKTIDKGYLIDFNDEQEEAETINTLLDFFEDKGFFENGLIKIISFSNFNTYNEFLENKEFINISMQKLLEKYKDADVFSLTTPYCPYTSFSVDKPFGEIKLEENAAKIAIEKLETTLLKKLERTYDLIKEKVNIIPFEELVKNINSEILEYREKKKRTLKKNGGKSFICDQFSRGKTNFKEPQELWEFYHDLEIIRSFEWIAEKLKKNKKECPLDGELNKKKYKELKNNLIETEITFVWHCSISSQLSKVFYFKLNEETKKWLLQFNNDYDIDFEDLAFYKDKEVVFSSCKHEGFHTDLAKKGDN